ncbi:MAG: glycolate oxidase subunit GlcE [Halothiobacillus sp. 39-53-45]|nr:MAG: glycolate oxidase subunit GlcE [Halothiobacillus sp. 39-53-45]
MGEARTSTRRRDLTPDLTATVAEAFAKATPLMIKGSGSKAFYGRATHGQVIDLSGHSGILEYEPAELVLTARAGTPLKHIEHILAQAGQMLPFEPPQFGDCQSIGGTIGGAVASGLSGPARPWQGAVRDSVLGVTLLSGEGKVLHFGGKVMKNVAGYDVSRLMAGALGTLGILLEVSIRVLPLPRVQQTQLIPMTATQALAHLAEWNRSPLPINGASFHEGALHVRLAGAHSAVHKAALRIGGEPLEPNAATRYWQALRDHHLPFFQAKTGDLWRVALPLTAPVDALPPACQLIDWGGQQRWLWLDHPSDAAKIGTQAKAARGHATLFCAATGNPEAPFSPLPAPLLALQQRVKAALDPKELFNRGRLYPEL